MLVIRRKNGELTQVIHAASGDELWIRSWVEDGRINLAFDDTPRMFIIERPERKKVAK